MSAIIPFRFFAVPPHTESNARPPTYVSHWKAVGTTSGAYVHSYALASTPSIVTTIYGVLYRQDIRVKQTHFNQFTVDVPYGTRKNETGQWTWDFDTTGGTVHITNGKQEVNRYPGSAPDQQAAIGVDGDEVKGTDIVIPAMKINVSFRHPLGFLTLAQAKYLNNITGTINSDPFLTFTPGEVLFLGARGSDGSEAEAQVNYQFAMSANADNLTIGAITNIAKKGWDVAWVRYEDKSEGGLPVRVPKHVYVDRVYEETAMALALGFGG